MITGETEQLLEDYPQGDAYDEFFGRKKRRRRQRRARKKAKRAALRAKRRSIPVRVKRRKKRKRFIKDVGQIYREVGGATAIGKAIDAITKPKFTPDYGKSTTSNPSDFSMDVGASKDPENEKKRIPTVVYVLGGVVVVGVIGLAVVNSQKNKQIQQY